MCEPVFDYGRTAAEWNLVDGGRAMADATGAGQTIRLVSDLALGIEGGRVRGRHVLSAGERALLRALLGRAARGAEGRRRGRGEDGRHGAFLARLAGQGADPRSPLPRADPTLGACDQGPDLHAHRLDGGCADDVVARDARRRAQLGLPVHVDARHDVHAAGAPLAQPRLGGRRVHGVRRRPRADRGRVTPDHVRDRRTTRPDRVDARPSLRVCRRTSRPDRERRVRPAPERRVRRGARLDPAPYAQEREAAAATVADRASPRPSAPRRSGASRTRASGRPVELPSTTSPRS